jgi:hypothetical protein
MACDINVLDIPVSPSVPASTDYVIFTLADGTSVLRAWNNVLTGLIPNDEEILVTASGGIVNNGDTFFIRPAFIGKRVRLWRNSIKQGTINAGGSYYTFTPSTGRFDIVPAATTGEDLMIEAY